MRSERPLSVLVRPRAPTFIQKFSADAAQALAEFRAITVMPQEHGLSLQALWEPDLDEAIEHLRRVVGLPLKLSKLQISYVFGEPILEPVLAVTVTCPETNVGDVIADLNCRRGAITDLDDVADAKQVRATVPLAELIGYVAHLRAMTMRSGAVSAVFYDYRPTPPGLGPRGPLANAMRA